MNAQDVINLFADRFADGADIGAACPKCWRPIPGETGSSGADGLCSCGELATDAETMAALGIDLDLAEVTVITPVEYRLDRRQYPR